MMTRNLPVKGGSPLRNTLQYVERSAEKKRAVDAENTSMKNGLYEEHRHIQ